jgi:Tol biopolymer transport system component
MRNSLKDYPLSPDEYRQLLETNGVKVEKIVGKIFTMPFGISSKKMTRENYPANSINTINEY